MQIKNNQIILGAIILQAILCLLVINSFPIALDEPFSIFHSQKNLNDLWEIFETENNPPLHFVLLHGWIKLFGISATAVRSLSLLFSLATIPFLYQFANRIGGKLVATLTLAFFVFSSFHHYHAIEARTYSLLVFLVVLILNDLHQFLNKQNKIRNLAIRLAVWNAVLLYTHYLAGLIIGVEVLLMLYAYKKWNKKKLIALLIAIVIMIVLYLPGINLFLTRMDAFTNTGTWVPEAQFSELYGNILRFFNGKFSFLGIVGLVLMFSWINRRRLKTAFQLKKYVKQDYGFVFIAFFASYLGMFIFSRLIEPVFLDRYLLFTSIPLFVLAAILVKEINGEQIKWISLLVIAPMLLFFKWVPENDRNPNEIADWVKHRKTNDTAIYLCPKFYNLTFAYHYDKKIFEDYRYFESSLNANHIFGVFSDQDIHFNNKLEKVIYIDANSEFQYANNGILALLKDQFELKESANFKGGIKTYSFNLVEP